MKKHYKKILYFIGLIATFGIDILIAVTTGFISHAGILEMVYIFWGIYLLD